MLDAINLLLENVLNGEYDSQRVDIIKREMFSQKSVRRFVGDSSAFVMGAMFLASALNRGISPGISGIFKYFRGVNASV